MILILILSFVICLTICTFWIIADHSNQREIDEFCEKKWRALARIFKEHFPPVDTLVAQTSEEKYLEGLIASLTSADLKVTAALKPLRTKLAKAVVFEKELELALIKIKERVSRWHERATLAVQQENDGLAKQALQRKLQYQKQVEDYSKELAANESAISSMRENLLQVEQAKSLFSQKSHILISRAKIAVATVQIHRRIAAANRQQTLSQLTLQIRELQEVSQEELIPSSQATMDNLSKLFEDIEIEVAAMEAHVIHGSANISPRRTAQQNAEAVQRELDEMKKAQENDQQPT